MGLVKVGHETHSSKAQQQARVLTKLDLTCAGV